MCYVNIFKLQLEYSINLDILIAQHSESHVK